MRRREFLLAAAASAWPLSTRAETHTFRLGWLAPVKPELDVAPFAAFWEGLRDLGYVEGRDIEIVRLFSDGDDAKLPALARDLVARNVDIIVTGGPALIAARQATSTIPIVFAAGDVLAFGIVKNLAHPGGNVTGSSYQVFDIYAKWIEGLKDADPAIARVYVLRVKNGAGRSAMLGAMDGPLKSLGVELELIEIAEIGECEAALSTLSTESHCGLLVVDVPQLTGGAGPTTISEAAARRRLPSVGTPQYAHKGGLLGYGVDIIPMFRRAATFVDKILRGTKAGDIPIEQATKFITVINLKTAKTLGLDVHPTLLAAADEVIE